MPVVHGTAILDDDTGMRLEQADDFFSGGHPLTEEDPAPGLIDHLHDQAV